MKSKFLRLLAAPALLMMSCESSQASLSLLVEEAIGGAGEFSGSGHAAIYFSSICSESPAELRPCRTGEEGAVISTYPKLGTNNNRKWFAVPLTAFLYSVDTRSDKPIYGNGKIRRYLRDNYRAAHFANIVPSSADGSVPPGRWSETLGGAINRDIYALTVKTTPQQDAKFLAEFAKLSKVNDFSTTYNNCADFARDTINAFFPGATHRDVLNDFTMTTPKAIARSFTRYASRRPELKFQITKYPQVDGAIRRSLNNRNFTEKALVSKKYFLSMAFTKPELIPIMGIIYLTTGWYNLDSQYRKNIGEGIVDAGVDSQATDEWSADEGDADDSSHKTPDQLRTKRRVDMFGKDELWVNYRKLFDPMLLRAVEAGFFRDSQEVKTFFKDLELQSAPDFDSNGRLILRVNDHGSPETLGITKHNLLSPDHSRRLTYKLMLAKVNAVLRAPKRNRPSKSEFEEDWKLLQTVASDVLPYDFAGKDRKSLPKFRQVKEVTTAGKKGQKFLMTITH